MIVTADLVSHSVKVAGNENERAGQSQLGGVFERIHYQKLDCVCGCGKAPGRETMIFHIYLAILGILSDKLNK